MKVIIVVVPTPAKRSPPWTAPRPRPSVRAEAEAAEALAARNLSLTTLQAPFAGIVTLYNNRIRIT